MDGLGFIIFLVILVMFGPPLLFLIIGILRRKSNPQTAKIFYILCVAYLVIGGGICASMMGAF